MQLILLFLSLSHRLLANAATVNGDAGWEYVLTYGDPDGTGDVDLGQTEFNDLFHESTYHILLRHCPDCSYSTHEWIYYRRTTETDSVDLYGLAASWMSTDSLGNGNEISVNFDLYSTLVDALEETNPWEYCNYDDSPVGMFRDCGLLSKTDSNWVKSSGSGGGGDARFYIYTGEWVEIATEPRDDVGSDVWRYLDFGSSIYEVYTDVDAYKLEFDEQTDGSYLYSIIFELADSYIDHHIFEDSEDSVDQNIFINVLESNVAGITTGNNQYFCKACESSGSNSRYGDTCWGILDSSETDRGCGCNSGGWTGDGVYYGGWESCDVCSCWGGAFAGYVSSGGQKGALDSIGVRLSILVTETDLCAGVVCNDSSLCTSDACDPATGECLFTDISSSCVDSDSCTDDSCDPDVGCVYTEWDCDNGNICDGEESCIEGVCVSPDDYECDTNFVCDVDAQECLRDCTLFAIDGYLTDCSAEFDDNEIQLEELDLALSDLSVFVSVINGNVTDNREDIDFNYVYIDSLETRAAALETQNVINMADIATNTANIIINAADIDTNEVNIESNTGRIQTNEGSISDNEYDIATNTDGVAGNLESIGNNTDNIATNLASIETNAQDIASGVGLIDALDVRLTLLEGRVYAFAPLASESNGQSQLNSPNENTNSDSESSVGVFDLSIFAHKDDLIVLLVVINVMLLVSLMCLGVCYCRGERRDIYIGGRKYAPVNPYSSADDEQMRLNK